MKPTSTPTELYVRLKNRTFQVEFDSNGHLPVTQTVPDHLVSAYLSQPATDYAARDLLEYSVEMSKMIGSSVIVEAKSAMAEPRDAPDTLTYEHLLVERIANPTQSIVLVGETGSGKTHKLKYILKRYVEPTLAARGPCRQSKALSDHFGRMWVDLDRSRIKTSGALYTFILVHLSERMRFFLSDQFVRRYGEFVVDLFARAAGSTPPPYFEVLTNAGLTVANCMDLPSLGQRVLPELRAQVVDFALEFCGWVRKHFMDDDSLRMHLVLDNVDATPLEVQNALVDLLMDTKPSHRILLICACRPETLFNWWDMRRECLDLIPHIGPTAHAVVCRRIDDFLAQLPANATLRDELQGGRDPEVYVANLRLIREALDREQLQTFFAAHFGWRIRDGIVFSQNVVDIAAANSTERLRDQVLRSSFAVERHLHRPWGLQAAPPHVINVFELGQEYRHRLGALRVLVMVINQKEFVATIEECWAHLRMFGYTSAQEVVRMLERMLGAGLLLVTSQERAKLGPFKKCKSERARLTQVGRGMWGHGYEFGYVSTMMFYTTARGERYEMRIKEGREPDLETTVGVFREFMRETWELEAAELHQCVLDGSIGKYADFYGERTISQTILREAYKSLIGIGIAERRRPTGRLVTLGELADRVESDEQVVTSRMATEFRLKPADEHDTAFEEACRERASW
jgi:hypothetical protein